MTNFFRRFAFLFFLISTPLAFGKEAECNPIGQLSFGVVLKEKSIEISPVQDATSDSLVQINTEACKALKRNFPSESYRRLQINLSSSIEFFPIFYKTAPPASINCLVDFFPVDQLQLHPRDHDSDCKAQGLQKVSAGHRPEFEFYVESKHITMISKIRNPAIESQRADPKK